jgi:bacterioferritin (cytochrome b1)
MDSIDLSSINVYELRKKFGLDRNTDEIFTPQKIYENYLELKSTERLHIINKIPYSLTYSNYLLEYLYGETITNDIYNQISIYVEIKISRMNELKQKLEELEVHITWLVNELKLFLTKYSSGGSYEDILRTKIKKYIKYANEYNEILTNGELINKFLTVNQLKGEYVFQKKKLAEWTLNNPLTSRMLIDYIDSSLNEEMIYSYIHSIETIDDEIKWISTGFAVSFLRIIFDYNYQTELHGYYIETEEPPHTETIDNQTVMFDEDGDVIMNTDD